MCRIKAWLFFMWMLIIANGHAQRLPLVNYTTRFPQLANGILQTFQDSKGWIWMVSGTQVMRYNGATLTVLQPATGVDMDFCYQLVEADGTILVNSRPYNLVVDADSLRPAPVWLKKFPVDASLRMNGRQYILGKKGLATVSKGSIQPVIKFHFKKDLYSHLLPFNDSLLLAHLAYDSLIVINIKSKRLYELPIQVNDMAVGNNNAILLVSHHELRQINSLSIVNDQVIIKDSTILKDLTNRAAICSDNSGNIWTAVLHEALIKTSPNAPPDIFTEKDIAAGLAINHIFHDRQDNIWLGMANGLLKIPPTRAIQYTSADGLAFNVTQDIYIKDELVLAPTFKGLSIFYNQQWISLKWQGKPFICQKIIDNKNGWYCIADNSLYQLTLDIPAATITHKKLIASLPANATDLVSDRFGNLYVSTHMNVWTMRAGKLHKMPLPDSAYKTLYVDSKDRLWCGQFGGPLDGIQIEEASETALWKLIIWNNTVSTAKPLAARGIAEDKRGNILIGTRFNGFYQLHLHGNTVQSFQHINTKNGLPSDAVWDIVVDKANRYWLVNEGITLLQATKQGWQIQEVQKLYGVKRSYQLAYQPLNKFWVSTPEGITSFTPGENTLHHADDIHTSITGIWINEERKLDTAQQRIRLHHDENNLLIEFSANTFQQEELVSYSYSFSNDDHINWSKPTTDNSVRFSAIAPGNYLFRVKAFDSYGNPLGNISMLHIRVAPAFYATSWFLLACALVALSIIYIFYRLRLRQVKKLMTIRNNISQNLHDDIGASLTNILLLNEMARKHANHPETAAPLLNRATEDIKRIGESLGDIVWNINPNNDQLSNVLAKMQRYAGEMLEGAEIQADLDFPNDLPDEKMQMDQRRDLYLVFKELIHNITRHANATEAKVTIALNDHTISMQVADNGKGFDLHNGIRKSGLRNMEERIKKWGGNFQVNSELGEGTQIAVSMPLQ